VKIRYRTINGIQDFRSERKVKLKIMEKTAIICIDINFQKKGKLKTKEDSIEKII